MFQPLWGDKGLIAQNHVVTFYFFHRHVIVSCQDEDKIKSNYAMSKVLRTIQVQTESYLMLLLITHILSQRFQLEREETIAEIG